MNQNTLRAVVRYLAGFLTSLACTLIAYWVAVYGNFAITTTVFVVALLALVQFAVQVRLFLHVGEPGGIRLTGAAFAFMVVIVAILVFGSLWIMANLDYNMQMPSDASIIEDEGFEP